MAIPTADELTESIATNATTKRIRTNAGDVEQQTVGEQLKLLQMIRDRENQTAGKPGIGLFQIRPGSAGP